MKLVTTIILIIHYAVQVNSNEQFVFPPKFQTPGTFVSESSLYLPPESHTPIPYFPVKKFGNLPFPYLPPTGTKSPVPFPSPFPIYLSSTRTPSFDDDDDNKTEDERENHGPSSSSVRPPFPYNKNNRTENVQEGMILKRDMRQIQKPMHYQQPIDRVDIRVPHQLPNGFSTPASVNQKPTPRSMIISAETHRNDNIFDQYKAGSSQNIHLLPPGGFISSTTEPAIPILRLSNEMDLDGSFSYEALGADQTHYVQHSHMENQGTEKEEQVVEGSYSYVGDNGQTYTVHYIADSNGFRASGDHLPVAPPVPEIIQRAIQYNLAEEAKKPPHLKSWQVEEQEREHNEILDKNQRFVIPPPRNLFTGRTPEAFSYDFAQRSPNTQNNIEAAASSQSVKTVDFTNNQQKQNINTGNIAPQVTFLASQGAVVPSANTPQQTVSRMFTNEKPLPSLPQLVNYEADDNNKALWRWQYGLNPNNQISNNANLNPEKNSISRSAGDDIVINFNEMTPEQYTNMLQAQLPSNSEKNMESSARSYDNLPAPDNINLQNNGYEKVSEKENVKYHRDNEKNMMTQSLQTTKARQSENWYRPFVDNNDNNRYLQQTYQQDNSVNNYQENSVQDIQSTTIIYQEHKIPSILENNPHHQKTYSKQELHHENIGQSANAYSTVINQVDVINPSKGVTHEYDFEDTSYEPRRIKALSHYTTAKPNFNNKNYVTNDEYIKMNTPSYSTQNSIDYDKTSTFTITQAPPTTTKSTIKFTDFIGSDDKDSFKPIVKTTNEENNRDLTDKIEDSDLSNNIFLKNILKPNQPDPKVLNNIKENTEKQSYKKVSAAETKSDKLAKYINIQSKPFNDITNTKKKTIDISEIINFITMKNHFESNKLNRLKNNPHSFGNQKPRNEVHYLPVDDKEDDDQFESYSPKQASNVAPNAHHHLGELHGNIKNYKVLQRNNNLSNGYETSQLKRELVPPPVKLLQSQNLPPLGRAGPSTRSYLPPIYV